MKKKEITSTFTEYSMQELHTADQELITQAIGNLPNAYSPYSQFRVSALIRTVSGKLIMGTNQENGAYPSGLCAERVAVFHLGAAHPGEIIDSIAIAANNQEGDFNEFIIPCGACLQVLSEFRKKQDRAIRVFLYSNEKKVLVAEDIRHFLPLQF